MFDVDEDGTNSIKPTDFDKARLESMNIGETIEGELCNWKVIRYLNDYTLILYDHPKAKDVLDFDLLEELVEFLDK